MTGTALFTLAHLSDPHLAPQSAPRFFELFGKRITGHFNWRRRRRHMHDTEILALLVDDMLAQAPDHIAVTGDIANIATRAEFPIGRAWLDTLGSAEDVSFVPGNHDAYTPGAARHRHHHWGGHMRGDDGSYQFHYLRRRGPLALIGLSSGVPTGFFRATGALGPAQLGRLARLLESLRRENVFRVVMIHHPPVSKAPRHKLLLDAAALKDVIAEGGADLLLHGHDHLHMLNWLKGPDGTRVPAIGVPSASSKPDRKHDPAAYNLYRIAQAGNGWRCEMISRGVDADGEVVEMKREMLAE